MTSLRKIAVISIIIIFVFSLSILIFQKINGLEVFEQKQPARDQSLRLYFAYGSNMNTAQMKERCGSGFKGVQPMRLSDYEFGFDKRGYANIRPKQGEFVWGFVWEIDQSCVNALDSYEGYPSVYNRKDILLINNSQSLRAFVYIEPAEEFGGVPQRDYLNNRIIPGAEENGLPREWIKKLKQY